MRSKDPVCQITLNKCLTDLIICPNSSRKIEDLESMDSLILSQTLRAEILCNNKEYKFLLIFLRFLDRYKTSDEKSLD